MHVAHREVDLAEVDVQHPPPVGRVELERRAHDVRVGVVDDDVDAAEALAGARGHARPVLGVGDVAGLEVAPRRPPRRSAAATARPRSSAMSASSTAAPSCGTAAGPWRRRCRSRHRSRSPPAPQPAHLTSRPPAVCRTAASMSSTLRQDGALEVRGVGDRRVLRGHPLGLGSERRPTRPRSRAPRPRWRSRRAGALADDDEPAGLARRCRRSVSMSSGLRVRGSMTSTSMPSRASARAACSAWWTHMPVATTVTSRARRA